MVPRQQHLCGCTLSQVFALFELLIQSTVAISLSRDTLSTIHLNQPYVMGYDGGKHFWLKKVHSQTCTSVGLVGLAQDEMRILRSRPGCSKIVVFNFNFEQFDDVDIGGETTIPPAKVSVTPTKGSAILWYNLNKASKFNYKTQHGSCPVVQGQKWVASTWTVYKDQTHLTCDLDENAPMEYLVNGKSKYNHPA